MQFLAHVIGADGVTVVEWERKALSDFAVNQWFIAQLEAAEAGQTIRILAQADGAALPGDWPAPFIAEGPQGPQGEPGEPGESGTANLAVWPVAFVDLGGAEYTLTQNDVVLVTGAVNGVRLPLLADTADGKVYFVKNFTSGATIPLRTNATDGAKLYFGNASVNSSANISAGTQRMIVKVNGFWYAH